jgi:phosphoserine phosphatase RsbU/P
MWHMPRVRRWSDLKRFWRQISPRAFAIFMLTVGVTFSSMGFLGDIVALDKQPFSTALYGATVSGCGAMAFAAAFTRNMRWLILAIAVQVGGGWFLAGPARNPPFARFTELSTTERLRYDRMGAVLAVFLGYNGFLYFIGGEGRRWIAVRAEMDLAHQIHQTLVPGIDQTVGRTEFLGVSQPSGQVGGDLVDLIELPDGEWLAYVADVSGHGVSSGLVMGMVKSAMRMGAGDRPTLPLLVRDLNRLMCSQLSPQMFVTLVAVRGRGDGNVETLCAGHPPMLCARAGAAGIGETASGRNVPIGVMPDWAFEAETIPFERGDLLALVTDGLFEVFDAADRDLGLDAIKRALLEAAGESLAATANRVIDQSRTFGKQIDDQTILVMRRV